MQIWKNPETGDEPRISFLWLIVSSQQAVVKEISLRTGEL